MQSRIGVALVALVLSVIFVACTAGNAAADMPPGIRASQWRPLGQNLGLVVQEMEANRMLGYFVCKVDGKWVRLSIQNPVAVVPAQ